MSISVLFFYGFVFLGIVYSSVFSVAVIRNLKKKNELEKSPLNILPFLTIKN